MSQDNIAKLECAECRRINYRTSRHKKRLSKVRLELKKHCKWCKKHTAHKETK
ncbi:MAG: 50S ribosomal protein L33 [Candidatus Uhrbacteria bacterium]